MADIVLMIVLWIYIYKGAAYMSPYNTTWENAISKCTIETPTIMFKGTEQNLSVAVNVTIIGNQEVWVGYYLAATAFHYVGCIKRGNMTAMADFEYNTPGLCYSACNKTYLIGVSMSKCYCINNTIPSKRMYMNCTKRCKSLRYIACGNTNYLSVYTTDSYAKSYYGSGGCLQYELRNNKSAWKWAGCNSDKQIMCTSNDTYIHEIYNDDTTIKMAWMPAMNICFKSSNLPTSIKDLEHLERKTNRGKSWTGVISSNVIYKSDYKAPYITPKRYGYLQKNEKNDTILKFSENGTIQRYTLCKNDITTEATTSQTTSENKRAMTSNKQFTESTKCSDKGTVTKDPTSSPTVTSISMVYSTSSKGPVSYTSTTSSTVSINSSDVIVPVSISTVAIILLVVIVVIITLKRRGTIQTKSCRKVQSDSSDYTTPEIHLAVKSDYTSLSPNYDQISVVELPSNTYTDYNYIHDKNVHLYSDLEKHVEGSYININIASHDNK